MAIDKTLEKTTRIDKPASEVWKALTTPDIIKQWLFGTTVTSDWKVGSPLLFTGKWEGKEYADKGTILKLENERVLEYNYWSGFSGLPDSPENYSVITFELTPVDNTTILTLKQSNFPGEESFEHTDKNWDATLDLLKKTVEK
jgi:uncharacterized protein YndB with AHSA1/START domain